VQIRKEVRECEGILHVQSFQRNKFHDKIRRDLKSQGTYENCLSSHVIYKTAKVWTHKETISSVVSNECKIMAKSKKRG
jgi:uncharacterized protein YbcV (DUF1398 family)